MIYISSKTMLPNRNLFFFYRYLFSIDKMYIFQFLPIWNLIGLLMKNQPNTLLIVFA